MQLWIYLISAMGVFVVAICQTQISSNNYFSPESVLCDVEDRVNRGCSFQLPYVRSVVSCLSQCSIDKSCVGASVHPTGLCFHHRECPVLPSSTSCTTENHQHRYMTKYCAHGTWDAPSKSCHCVDGFFGVRCKQCHEQCADLLGLKYAEGVHRIYIDPNDNGRKPFWVMCYLSPSSSYSSTHLFRNRGQQDFNKTWTEYVNGFYYDNDHFWAGLYAFHRLCQSKQLIFVLEFPSLAHTPAVYRLYDGMTVSDENTGYSFTTSYSHHQTRPYTPTDYHFGDCLEPLQNVPFSTWDSDGDNSTIENCAANAASGWWYEEGCDNPCNALGWGLSYRNSKPRRQVMSLLGVDLDSLSADDQIVFFMYFWSQLIRTLSVSIQTQTQYLLKQP